MAERLRSNVRRASNALQRSLRWLPFVDYGYPPPPRVKKGQRPVLSKCLQEEIDRYLIKELEQIYGRPLYSDECGSLGHVNSNSVSSIMSECESEDWESNTGYQEVHPLDYYKVMVLKDFDRVQEQEIDGKANKSGCGRLRKFFTDLKIKLSRSKKLNPVDVGGDNDQIIDGSVAIPTITKVDMGLEAKISVLSPEDPTKYHDLADMLALRLARRSWENVMKELGQDDQSISQKSINNTSLFSTYTQDIDDLAKTTSSDELAEIKEAFWMASF